MSSTHIIGLLLKDIESLVADLGREVDKAEFSVPNAKSEMKSQLEKIALALHVLNGENRFTK